MTTTVNGPMFEGSESEYWKSVHNKQGAHYNIYALKHDENGMQVLRAFFNDDIVWKFNQLLFSTSGVHGTSLTIEDAETCIKAGMKDEDGEDYEPSVTFLIIQPRIVCMRYGNCEPKNQEDIDFLKLLRQKSFEAVLKIGVQSCGEEG